MISKTVAALIVILPTILAGCGGGGGGTSGLTPSITSVTAIPSTLASSAGGLVLIQAVVSAPRGVGSVRAVIIKPDLTSTTTDMALTAANTYTATYTAPENLGGSDEVYSVVVTLMDITDFAVSSSPVTFTVPSLIPPPPPG